VVFSHFNPSANAGEARSRKVRRSFMSGGEMSAPRSARHGENQFNTTAHPAKAMLTAVAIQISNAGENSSSHSKEFFGARRGIAQ